jgi:VWFA-related protein
MRLALVLIAAVASQIPATPTFRGRADVVAVDANVRRGGRPVTDLKAEDFEIIDNGVAQHVADLSFGRLPIDVTLALDISTSVTGDALSQFRRGIDQLVADLGADDRLKLITFNQRVKRVLDLGRTTTAAAALNEIRTTGSTAIFDTIAVALTTRAEAERRQLLLVFSDGRDSSSTTDAAGLVDVIRRTTPTIGFVLAPTLESTRSLPTLAGGQASSSGSQVSLPTLMRSAVPSRTIVARGTYDVLARESGGTVLLADSANLGDAFKRLLQDFRASYVLHFRPTGVERSGLHTIDVRIKRPGFEVRARRSYDW